jgi:hypothetical protein
MTQQFGRRAASPPQWQPAPAAATARRQSEPIIEPSPEPALEWPTGPSPEVLTWKHTRRRVLAPYHRAAGAVGAAAFIGSFFADGTAGFVLQALAFVTLATLSAVGARRWAERSRQTPDEAA